MKLELILTIKNGIEEDPVITSQWKDPIEEFEKHDRIDELKSSPIDANELWTILD